MHATPHHMAALKQRAHIGPAGAKAGGREHTSQAPQPRAGARTSTGNRHGATGDHTTPHVDPHTSTEAETGGGRQQARQAPSGRAAPSPIHESAHIVIIIMLMLC